MKNYDEIERVYGIYIHKKNGKLCIASKVDNSDNIDWEIDQGLTKNHFALRVKLQFVKSGTGNYFFNRLLRNYELLDETQDFNSNFLAEENNLDGLADD